MSHTLILAVLVTASVLYADNRLDEHLCDADAFKFSKNGKVSNVGHLGTVKK
jgi:hypothetical protein